MPAWRTGPSHCSPAVDSDDEGSEDEEAERNLPLLSQYLQSGGKSPQQLRRQRGASTTPGTGGRSPPGDGARQPGSGAVNGQSPLGEQASPAGPQASPLESADPRMLGERRGSVLVVQAMGLGQG